MRVTTLPLQAMKRQFFKLLFVSVGVIFFTFTVKLFHVTYNNSGESLPTIYIVEEHHEVFPLWFEVFRKIRQPLPLIHIDAHSDYAPFEFVKESQISGELITKDDLRPYMRVNDDFITAAQFTKMVSDLGWIYPFWVKDDFTDEKMILGVTSTDFNDSRTEHLCECPYPIRRSEKPSCFSLANIRSSKQKVHTISFKSCQYRHGPLVSWALSDINATKNGGKILRNYAYEIIPENAPYFLDIDLDFFAVELVGHVFVRSKIDFKFIERIDDILMDLFCPTKTYHEYVVDMWYTQLLQNIKNCKINIKRCLINILAKHQVPQKILCEKNTANEDVENLVSLLIKLNSSQLQVLQKVGVCLLQSIRTYTENVHTESADNTMHHKIHICQGTNLPGDTAVAEHKIKNNQELNEQMEKLEIMLKSLSKNPQIITICRSSRDGYLPKQILNQIEIRVLEKISKVYGTLPLVYDTELHGGKDGWISHKKKQFKKLQIST